MKKAAKVVIVIFFLLITYHLSLFTSSAYAAPGLPDPKPCQFSENTDKLTDNYIVNEDGEPPLVQTVTKTGNLGNTATIQVQESFTVDFSKLQSIFGVPNSDYLEGKFQNEEHRTSNLLDLKSAAFNLFHGSGQKAAAKPIVDDLKVKYVEYVYNKPTLPEAANKYTDIKNEGNPITVYQMIIELGFPYPPVPPRAGKNRTQWLNTWGKYWEKIPTAYSEFYVGYLEFRVAAGEKLFQQIKDGEACPDPLRRPPIVFVMPEFWRTTSISNQLNRIVVPCAAQSWRHGTAEDGSDDKCGAQASGAVTLKDQNQSDNLLSKTINFCKNLITGPPKKLLKQLQKVIQTSFKHVDPLQDAFAADPAPASPSPSPSCIKILARGKEGVAPYCALPATFNLMAGDSCTNKVSENKLDKENPNVVCTFVVSWDTQQELALPQDNPFWDSCTPNDDDTHTCSTKIRIWPVFRIPFLSEIWNNTMYSNEAEGEPNAGVGSRQETGRPGIYSSFTPKAIYSELFEGGITREKYEELAKQCKGNNPKDLDTPACQELFNLLKELEQKYPDIDNPNCDPIFPTRLLQCFAVYWGRIPSKNLPGQVADNSNVAGAKTSVLGATSDDAKERFIGATDCNKFFTRDIALKPKALQEAIGIDKQECNLEAAAIPEVGGDGGDIEPPAGCPAAFNLNPHQTTVEELQCYIVSRASGQIEPISGEDLARVMLNVMNDESGGDQCNTAGAGEIGVFQYIASTWHDFHSDEVDSGSINSPCWGNPGTDPYPYAPGPGDINFYLWPSNYSGTNDGGAWNPFMQIDTTISVMSSGGACNWSTFKLRYGGC